MSSFTTPLRVERLDGPRRWRVYEAFTYRIGDPDSDQYIVVPKGFVTDLASIPRGLWNLFPPAGGQYDKAAVLHDYLYNGGCIVEIREELDEYGYYNETEHSLIVTRRLADHVLLEAMQVLGVGWFARSTIYAGVRVGGRRAWRDGHGE
jgi:hypothetical protein